MATPTPAIKLTYEDYCNTPDDERYELLDGDLLMTPAPRVSHQKAVIKLGARLYYFVEERELGVVLSSPSDVVLSDTDVVQPDLLFVSNERAHIVTEDNIQGAPDLVVEILSPSTADRDLTVKRALYAKHGIQEYWIVDTDARTVTVLLRDAAGFVEVGVCAEGQTLASPTLVGFTINPDAIF